MLTNAKIINNHQRVNFGDLLEALKIDPFINAVGPVAIRPETADGRNIMGNEHPRVVPWARTLYPGGNTQHILGILGKDVNNLFLTINLDGRNEKEIIKLIAKTGNSRKLFANPNLDLFIAVSRHESNIAIGNTSIRNAVDG